MHQVLFLNQAYAFFLLNLSVPRLNFVDEGVECKSRPTFDTGRLLVLTKLRTNPYAAPPCGYSLCDFWCSDFEKDPASSLFDFGILIQNQSRRYTSGVK